MPDGLPRTILCTLASGLCRCPAMHAPYRNYPCDNCPERRKHARGCPATPYPGDAAGACSCAPLPGGVFCCPRRQTV